VCYCKVAFDLVGWDNCESFHLQVVSILSTIKMNSVMSSTGVGQNLAIILIVCRFHVICVSVISTENLPRHHRTVILSYSRQNQVTIFFVDL
jgi:hypothetical protein